MRTFGFHPELFTLRTKVIESLSEAGFEWNTDYTGVDLDHNNIGIEVEGIPTKAIADQIYRHLSPILANLPHRCGQLNEWYRITPGWKLIFSTYDDGPDETWD